MSGGDPAGASGATGPSPERCPSAGVAVGHAWHAAEPEDEQRLLEHLLDCAVCEAVIVDALAVGAELAVAVPPRDPPAALRDRILAAVAAEPDPPAQGDGRVPRTPARMPPAPERPAGDSHAEGSALSRVGAASDRRPPRPRRAVGSLMLVTVAVVLGVALLAGRALLPGSSGTDQASPGPTPDPSSLAAQAAQVVDDARADDPDVRHAVLRDDDGRAVAVVLDGGRDASPRVVALALAPPPAGRSWVLWGTGAGSPRALGAVDRSTGRPMGTGDPAPGPGWRGFAVSEEPSGPVPARPTEMLAIGPVV